MMLAASVGAVSCRCTRRRLISAALTGEIVSDGSSTVGPLTQAVAEEFAAQAPNVQISVDISGTGGGFERFCNGETDLQNASRAIEEEELANCAANGVEWYEFEVAYDGVTVVTNPENTWATCLTTDQLKQLWQKESPAMTWADLNPEWPADTVNLYGPGTDSGTFDFFVETILGEDDIREDFTPSEDDNVLVEGVSGDVNALGYFGAAYYEANKDILTAVGDRCWRWQLCAAYPRDDSGRHLRAPFPAALRLRERELAFDGRKSRSLPASTSMKRQRWRQKSDTSLLRRMSTPPTSRSSKPRHLDLERQIVLLRLNRRRDLAPRAKRAGGTQVSPLCCVKRDAPARRRKVMEQMSNVNERTR